MNSNERYEKYGYYSYWDLVSSKLGRESKFLCGSRINYEYMYLGFFDDDYNLVELKYRKISKDEVKKELSRDIKLFVSGVYDYCVNG